MKTDNSRSGTEIPVMSYSALYHQVLTKIDAIQPRSGRPTTCDSPLKAKSQTACGARRRDRAIRALRASKSSEQASCRDASTRLVPAIMAVQRASVELKASPRSWPEGCESAASSERSGEASLRWGRKNKGAKYSVDIDVLSGSTGSPPTETATESSLDLDIYVSDPSYDPSSLRTSDIPASPRGGVTYRRPVAETKRRRPPDDLHLLSQAERAVGRLLGAVLAREAAQAEERRAIADPVERGAAEGRHRRANDAAVRAWLAERGVWAGTAEAARFGAAWEEVRRARGDATSRGISFGAWLGEKRGKDREEQAREEAKRREKEEAQQVRREKAQQAYDKWVAEAASRPTMPQLVMYVTERGTRKYVRRGSFCNPNPWVDILEEEKRAKQQQQQQQVAASGRPCARPRPPPTQGGVASSAARPPPTRGGVGSLFPLTMTRLGGDGKRRRRSTYDSVVEFYADLLRRCQPRGRQWGEVPVHGRTRPHAHTPLTAGKPAHAQTHKHARTLAYAQEQIHSRMLEHAQEQIQAHENLYSHMPVYVSGTVNALGQDYAHTSVQAHRPVHDLDGQVYAHAPVHTHHSSRPLNSVQEAPCFELVHNVHAPGPVQGQVPGLLHGYMPVYSQEQQVHAVRYGHAYVPVYSQEQYAPGLVHTYNYEPEYVHGPAQTHMPVDNRVPVNSVGQLLAPGPSTLAPEPVPADEPVHAPKPEDGPQVQYTHTQVQGRGQLEERALQQAQGLEPPSPRQLIAKVHVQALVHDLKDVQAPTPVHVPGPIDTPGPIHTSEPIDTSDPVRAPRPIPTPVPIHALTPVHGHSLRKAQAAGL